MMLLQLLLLLGEARGTAVGTRGGQLPDNHLA